MPPYAVYILLTLKDIVIYIDAFTSNCPAILPQVVIADFEQALRSAGFTSFPGAEIAWQNCEPLG